jgi:hypothetical protein
MQLIRRARCGAGYDPVKLAEGFLKMTGNPSRDMGGMCIGDSGRPVLNGETNTVLAVHSFTYSAAGACNGVAYSFRLDQPSILTWIHGWMPTD